jgi:predicted RNA-binding Zn-ribbon protein involved in translation (DUF1610 family)
MRTPVLDTRTLKRANPPGREEKHAAHREAAAGMSDALTIQTSRWKCPTCHRWVNEQMARRCAVCRQLCMNVTFTRLGGD